MTIPEPALSVPSTPAVRAESGTSATTPTIAESVRSTAGFMDCASPKAGEAVSNTRTNRHKTADTLVLTECLPGPLLLVEIVDADAVVLGPVGWHLQLVRFGMHKS